MINTIQIKQQQLSKGFFTVGSGSEVVLVMGSCRVVNYVTYLDKWNKTNGNRFTIHSLDPFNWWWDKNDNRVDAEKIIAELEANQEMLDMISSVDIFLHEFYQNFGMFNCSKKAEKTIYDFGMKAKIDVCIPSWNDLFVLFADIVAFNPEIRKTAIQDFNVLNKLSYQTELDIFRMSLQAIDKFNEVCRKSDVPEMEEYFKNNFQIKRLFWSYNHVSKHFTYAVFNFINDKFLKLDLSNVWLELEGMEDIFANNYTKTTDYDLKWFDYKWNELCDSLRSKL